MWSRLDDSFADHPKVMALVATTGNAGVGVFARTLSYCARHLTDGVVPEHVLRSYCAPDDPNAIVAALLSCGFIEPHSAGYSVHDYLHYNRPSSEQKQKRSDARERMQKLRGRVGTPTTVSANESRTSGELRAKFGDPVPVPVPFKETESARADAHARAHVREAEPDPIAEAEAALREAERTTTPQATTAAADPPPVAPPPSRPRRTPGAPSPDEQAVFDHWRKVMNKPAQTVLSPERLNKVRQRFRDGYTVDQLCRAIDGCARSPHNMGANDRRTLYNDLELICRTAAHVDRFASAGGAPAASAPPVKPPSRYGDL